MSTRYAVTWIERGEVRLSSFSFAEQAASFWLHLVDSELSGQNVTMQTLHYCGPKGDRFSDLLAYFQSLTGGGGQGDTSPASISGSGVPTPVSGESINDLPY